VLSLLAAGVTYDEIVEHGHEAEYVYDLGRSPKRYPPGYKMWGWSALGSRRL